MLQRVSAHFASEAAQTEADTAVLLAQVDELAGRLQAAAVANSGLLDGLRALSDELEDERAAQLVALKSVHNSQALSTYADGGIE